MPHDDVLHRIDATLDALFPPDPTLDERAVERILRDEIEVDDEIEADDDEIEADDVDEETGETDVWDLFEPVGIAPRVLYGCEDSQAFYLDAGIALRFVALLDDADDEELPWVEQYQSSWLPPAVVERYGEWFITPDGECVRFRADDVDAVVAELEAGGIWCRRDDALVVRAVRES